MQQLFRQCDRKKPSSSMVIAGYCQQFTHLGQPSKQKNNENLIKMSWFYSGIDTRSYVSDKEVKADLVGTKHSSWIPKLI